MVIETRRFRCACGEVFEAQIVLQAAIDVFAAAIKHVRCPKCSAGYKKLEIEGSEDGD